MAARPSSSTSPLAIRKGVERRGTDASSLWTSPDRWPDEWSSDGPAFDAWFAAAGAALAYAIVASSSVIDFEAAVIDGWMPAEARRKLVDAVRNSIAAIDVEGLRIPDVLEGTVGIHARARRRQPATVERFLVGATASTA